MPVKDAQGRTLVTLIPGDGVGPECIEATRRIIEASGVQLSFDIQHAGESVFKKGIPSGVPQETIDSIRKT
ncbi:MAG: isocitrate/isopropylmalate family dehydrogenase, partial [Phycisphaerae bacterium]